MDKIILDIVPLTRIPLTRNQSFSYLSDRKLPAGTLVSIPLFRRSVEGIVTGYKSNLNWMGNIHPVKFAKGGAEPFNRIKLKKINKVIEANFLDEKQLKLAEFISEYYISPLGIVLKSFVPRRAKSRSVERITQNAKEKKKIQLTKEQESAVNEITKNYKLKTKNYLLYGPSASGKTEVYIHSILKLATRSQHLQFLILLPELTLTPQAIERYGQYFKPEEIAVINSRISKGHLYSDWQKIKSGEIKIIIGTRMAIFAPFKKLGLIVIDEEQDMSFKQWDMNPRYDARTAAEKLSEIHQCPLVRGSATPSIETYYQTDQGKYKLLKLSKLNIPNTKYQIPDTRYELVDLKKERWINLPTGRQGNYSPISKKLKSEIEYALRYKQQVILFINRQGMSAFSVCADCKTVLKCPNCERALVYDQEGVYKCAHCAYRTSITPQCTNCRGLVFKNIGLGTQKVEREIRQLFPQARITRADTSASHAKNFQTNLYRDFADGKIDILIGTQMIAKSWDLPTAALVGIIDADALLALPDFNAAEKAFQNLIQVSGRVGRPGAKMTGQVVIQTFNPENKLFKIIQENRPEDFYQAEISEREALKLPPFGKLIKLTIQDPSEKKAASLADSIYGLLKNTDFKNVTISEPQRAYLGKIRGRWRYQIVIKYKEKLPNLLSQKLKSLPTGTIIDVDPISII